MSNFPGRFSVLVFALAVGGGLISSLRADDQTGGMTIAPPAPMPATIPATVPATEPAATPTAPDAATAPATQPATSSAENVLENLLKKDAATPGAPASVPSQGSSTVATTGVAPDQPAATRLREGQPIWNRVGRLVKDDKSPFYLFTFDSDGKTMEDPPMPVLPSRMLMAMESASESGSKPTKFKVSGQVTEYHGKNYLLINYMQTVKDLNQF